MGEYYAWLAGLQEVRNVPGSPVDEPLAEWSRPKELAGIIGDLAKAHASDG